MANTRDKCLDYLRTSREDVFRTLQFAEFGGRTSVQRALAQLIEDGQLVRIGVGVYARAKRSVLSGKPIPVQPLEVLAPQALALFGVQVEPSRAVRDYNAGKTTQVPGSGVVLNTGKRRVTRRIAFNGQGPSYERG